MPQPHGAHNFRRLLSQTVEGMALYGCDHNTKGPAGCGATEVRRINQASPFALRREAAKRKGASA